MKEFRGFRTEILIEEMFNGEVTVQVKCTFDKGHTFIARKTVRKKDVMKTNQEEVIGELSNYIEYLIEKVHKNP